VFSTETLVCGNMVTLPFNIKYNMIRKKIMNNIIWSNTIFFILLQQINILPVFIIIVTNLKRLHIFKNIKSLISKISVMHKVVKRSKWYFI